MEKKKKLTIQLNDIVDLYFGSDLLSCERLLLDDHPESEESHKQAMSSITKHHSEEEWKANDGEGSRIHFTISSNSVGVHQVLETRSELVGTIVRWRNLSSHHTIQNRRNRAPTSFLITGWYCFKIMIN